MRSTRLTVTLAVAAILASALPASAATFSSPLMTSIAGQQTQCRVSNVGTKPVNVTGTFYDSFGNVVVPSGDTCAMLGGVLPAGNTCSLSIGAGAVRCVVDATSSKMRVVVMVSDINGILATEAATRK